MIVLDRLMRRKAASAAWKATALAWSVAVLAAAGSLPVHAQSTAPSSPAAHPASGSAVASASTTVPMPDHYTVQKGQSLLDVAADLTQSTDKSVKQNLANALFAANPGAFYGNNASRLKVGAMLTVPHPGESAASAPLQASAAAASAASSPAIALPASSAAAGQTNAHVTPATPAGASQSLAAPGASTLSVASQTVSTQANAAQVGAAQAVAASAGQPAPAASTAASASSAASGAEPVNAAASGATVAASTPVGASAAQPVAVPAPASDAHAWTGSIQPAPAGAIAASEPLASSAVAAAAPTQNVSSLQQLLQLKNRVLAAMQSHGVGSGASASSPAGTSPASGVRAGVSPSAAGSGATAPASGGLRGPLAVPAAFAVLIVVALGIWVCLPARRRKRPLEDDDLAPHGSSTPDSRGPGEAGSGNGSSAGSQGGSREDPVEHEAGRSKDEGPEGHSEFSKLPPEDDPIFGEAGRDAALDEPPFSLETGATGGLPTHDPQRSAFAKARTPFDTGLLLGLLEMHAHRQEVERYQETAHELWELTDGEGPDWQRAAMLGRQIDPDNPLYAEDPFAAYRDQHSEQEPGLVKSMPDVDLNLPHDDAQLAPGNTADRDARAPHGDASPASDALADRGKLDWLDEPSSLSSVGAREAFQPHTPGNAVPSEDAATLPEARQPLHVPVAEVSPQRLTQADSPLVSQEMERGTAGAASVAGLGATSDEFAPIDRDEAQIQTPSPVPAPMGDGRDLPLPPSLFSGDAVRRSALRDTQADSIFPRAPQPAHPNIDAFGFGALKLDFDLELSPNAAAPGSMPTSTDLATIARNKLDLASEYVELGDRSGARTLLNEVLATHDLSTRERAQSLLDSLK